MILIQTTREKLMRYIILLLWCCTSWVHAEDTLEQRVIKLEQEVTVLKQQVETLNATVQKNVIPPTANLRLILSRWYLRDEKVKFSTYSALDIELTNNFEKGIKEIDASVKFSDLLGGLLYTVRLGKQLSLPPGQTLVDKGTQANQRLITEQHPLRRLDEHDVKVELTVRKIVFDDDSLWVPPAE
jgi:uncharacterized coiled-coil protein SlyX